MSEIAIDTLEADEWIDSTLRADPVIVAAVGNRIYSEQAPKGVDTYPLIVYGTQTNRDIRGLGGYTIMVDALMQVRVISEGVSYLPMRALANRIHELLHDRQYIPAASGGMIVTCTREEPLRFPTIEGGKHYRHLGGLYRIQISH